MVSMENCYLHKLAVPRLAAGLFITGTDTDVGKTVVTAMLAALAVSLGKKVAVAKPAQTGLSEYPGDMEVVGRMAPGITDLPPELSCPCRYAMPASPRLAAATEGKTVDLDAVRGLPGAILANHPELDLLLLEGAGGVMVPLDGKYTFLDLMVDYKMRVALVGRAGLGTINHTLLSLRTLLAAGVEVAGVILNGAAAPPTHLESDNAEVIEEFSGIPLVAMLPRWSASSPEALGGDIRRWLDNPRNSRWRRNLESLLEPRLEKSEC